MSKPFSRFRRIWLSLVFSIVACSALYLCLRMQQVFPPGKLAAASSLAPLVNGLSPRAGGPSRIPGPIPHPAPSSLAHRALFSYVPAPDDAALIEARLAAPTKSIHYVKLDDGLIGGKASPFWRPRPGEGQFGLPLPNGQMVTMSIDRSEMVGAGRFTSTGRIAGREATSRAVFSYNAGILQAMIEDTEYGAFTLRYGDGGVSQFFAVDPAQAGQCAGSISGSLDARALANRAGDVAQRRAAAVASAEAVSPGSPGRSAAADAASAQRPEIHLMMLFTPSVAAAVGSAAAVQGAFDLAVAVVNSDLERSLISVRIRLVRVAQLDYNEGASAATQVFPDALIAVSEGLLAEVGPLRDDSGADLVNLVINRAEVNPDGTTTVGVAYRQTRPSLVDPTVWEYNSLFGFSVVSYASINSQHALSHELGHNLGCAHDRDNTPGPGAYSYSYGYRFTGADGRIYRDIMAFQPGDLLPYFSNPDVVPTETGVAVPIGIAAGFPGESNNALTIERNAFEVSMYRLQQFAPVAQGTLINVATLAVVGIGDQQLIGGFVVNGPNPKTMLVRGAGPALVTLGVGGVLANPQLSLIRTDVSPFAQIAQNDDWSTPLSGGATGAAIAAAATQVGAFPFAAASSDAAVLATLNPGNYTVNIVGAGNSTGTALVEAYEVGANASRVVNLATRGFIDVGKSMTAGFVISGNAGETKRILIRVRGASLAQFGLNGADDPVLTLYDASSRVLVQNDDFSSDDTLGNSVIEGRIIATGFAPSNRREPCIIADLLPGAYTALAVPFEDLRVTPALVAKPGIAVIEVYEIN